MINIVYRGNTAIIGELQSVNDDIITLKNPLMVVASKEGIGLSQMFGEEEVLNIKYDMFGEVSGKIKEFYNKALAEIKAKNVGIDLETPRNPKVVKELFNKN